MGQAKLRAPKAAPPAKRAKPLSTARDFTACDDDGEVAVCTPAPGGAAAIALEEDDDVVVQVMAVEPAKNIAQLAQAVEADDEIAAVETQPTAEDKMDDELDGSETFL